MINIERTFEKIWANVKNTSLNFCWTLHGLLYQISEIIKKNFSQNNELFEYSVISPLKSKGSNI